MSAAPAAEPALHRALGLTDDEAAAIEALLGSEDGLVLLRALLETAAAVPAR